MNRTQCNNAHQILIGNKSINNIIKNFRFNIVNNINFCKFVEFLFLKNNFSFILLIKLKLKYKFSVMSTKKFVFKTCFKKLL